MLKFRNPKNTDWKALNEHVSRSLPRTSVIDTISNLNATAKVVNDAIINGFKAACPEKIIKASRSAEFFTTETKKLRSELRKAFNKLDETLRESTIEQSEATKDQY